MLTANDAEIAHRYVSGQSTYDIAQDLNIRLIEVIGRIRALRLDPPGMGVRYSPECEAEAGPATARAPVRSLAQAPERRLSAAAAMQKRPVPVPAADNDPDDDEPVQRNGCPRGWLVSEVELAALFARAGGRFEDVVIRARRPAAEPLPCLSGQFARPR